MNKENFALTYFISQMLFSGTIFSTMFNKSGADSLIACFLGIIIGLLIIYLIHKMNFDSNSFRLIQIALYLYFIIIFLSTVETFVNSFLLYNTPVIFILIPVVIFGTYGAFKSTTTLRKAATIFIFMSISFYLLTILSLTSYLNLNNILPLLTHKPIKIISSAFTFGILSAFPNILLKEENIPLKKHLLFYTIASLFNTYICFYTLAVLTPNVAKIYSFPEYMVLKRIKILGFIDNIENLSSIAWYFDYYYFISFAFKRLYNIIKNKIIYFVVIILTALFTINIIVNNYHITLLFYKSSTLVMSIFLLLMCTTIFKKKKIISTEIYK